MVANGSREMANLWNWSAQFKGPPGYMGMDLQTFRMETAIRAEVESMGGKWTRQDRFAFPTKDQLSFFRMKWG
jgi:hypothetical protein